MGFFVFYMNAANKNRSGQQIEVGVRKHALHFVDVLFCEAQIEEPIQRGFNLCHKSHFPKLIRSVYECKLFLECIRCDFD